MKILLKYGIIGGVLMLAATYPTITPYVKDYFDNSISSASMFVILGGVNLFGINAYLKTARESRYSYGTGLAICFGIGLIGSLVYSTAFILLIYHQHDFLANVARILSRMIQFLPLIIICSIIIPLFFANKKREVMKIENVDILDSDLNDES